ncbi:hypothetical protein CRE_08606 [Caenorhabditis remanei]|uniref:Uncharacterized protein n=1 Tax=Caenorhabditis remanei TaxID=31234 RepID=E3NJH9_CAERE|nr:hypothetical protein CRE_08606 [Caenorhabditis remanei]
MWSYEIDQILFNDRFSKKWYKGTVMADKLPKKRPRFKKFGYIVNTDPSNEPGRHWQSIFVNGNTCFFFCSLAEPPNVYIQRFLRLFPRVIQNPIRHQSLSAVTCGGYCIFIQSMMSRGVRFETLCEIFIKMVNDDLFIVNYLKDAYNYFI